MLATGLILMSTSSVVQMAASIACCAVGCFFLAGNVCGSDGSGSSNSGNGAGGRGGVGGGEGAVVLTTTLLSPLFLVPINTGGSWLSPLNVELLEDSTAVSPLSFSYQFCGSAVGCCSKPAAGACGGSLSATEGVASIDLVLIDSVLNI